MRRILVTFFLLSATVLGSPQSRQKWVYADHATRQIEAYRKRNDVPGVSIAVAKKGQIIFAKGFGFADVERGARVRPTDFFRLASVSKPITATLIFELIEQGKVSLDTPARQYLPELPPHHTYLVRDLLCHQSGIRHYENDETPKHYSTQVAALSVFAKDPLRSLPGDRTQYSTHAYVVLGALIEKVVGKPYQTYVAERMRIWGIKDVQCESGENANRTKIYTRVQGKTKVAKRDDLSWKFAGGGCEATATGMCNLGSAILAGKILKPESLQTMWTLQKHESMSLGWNVYDTGTYRVAGHNGQQRGANSRWGLVIGGDVVIMVLSNRSGHKPWQVLEFLEVLAMWDGKGKQPTIQWD